jgi:hypothetical protein
MVNTSIQCGIPGCGTLVPSELKSDGCCVLTTFLTLMILHENLVDRPANLYVPRRVARPEAAALTAAANF